MRSGLDYKEGTYLYFLSLPKSLVTLVLHPHPESETDAIGVAGDTERGRGNIGANPRGCFVRFRSRLGSAWTWGK